MTQRILSNSEDYFWSLAAVLSDLKEVNPRYSALKKPEISSNSWV